MAFTSIRNSELYWPVRTPLATLKAHSGSTSADRTFVSSLTMNDAADDIHMLGYIRWADGGTNKTISTISFVPTNLSAPIGTLRVGLQTPLAGVTTKRGDGTFDVVGTVSAATLTADAVNTVSVTGAPTYSDGDYVSVSMDWSSWSSGSLEFRLFDVVTDVNGVPCSTLNTVFADGIPNVLLRSTGGTYGVLDGAGWGVASSTVSVTSGSSPNQIGNRFVCPGTMKVNGVWVRRSLANATSNDFYVGIYNSDGTTVVERLVTSDEYAATAGEYRLDTYKIAETTLTGGLTYYVAVKAANATNAISVEKVSLGSNSYGTPLPGGLNVYCVSRTLGSGAFFTNDQNAHFSMGVLISAIDDGSGTGWVPGSGTTGNTLKVLVDPSAVSATSISGVVFAAPTGNDIVGAKIGEFTGESVEAALEDGQAVLKVPVSSFNGTGLLLSDTPVVLFRNETYTTGMVPATVINE